PIEMGGILAAALFCAFIIDTDEGDRRELALDTDEQREAWFKAYEREVRREDWGYLSAEIAQLRDNYVQLAVDSITLHDICPNNRLLELAMELTVTYMQHLVLKIYRDHIWEVMPWEMPFPQWLIDAARVETRRQRYLQTDWTDAPIVIQLADMPDETEAPTFFFEGEKASDIPLRNTTSARPNATRSTVRKTRAFSKSGSRLRHRHTGSHRGDPFLWLPGTV
ncbi:MAG: hypothetical protein IIU06_05120, partial [Erysipelotrichales bacterium]|nr:hypothetical protein [Erysipelotrichales bacterium]